MRYGPPLTRDLCEAWLLQHLMTELMEKFLDAQYQPGSPEESSTLDWYLACP